MAEYSFIFKQSFGNNFNSYYLHNNNLLNDSKLNQNNNNYEVINYSTKISQFTNNYDSAKQSIETGKKSDEKALSQCEIH